MSKHSPAPWTWGNNRTRLVDGMGHCILLNSDLMSDLCIPLVRGTAGAHANARLIEAAPDLLAALKELLHMPEFDGTPEASLLRRDAKRAARAAIDRAGD